MRKLAIACKIACSGGDYELPLLVASIRRFGGKLANIPIWVFTPNSIDNIPTLVKEQITKDNIEYIPYPVNSDLQKFPLGDFVLAASHAEAYAKDKAEVLIWLDSATIILNEPIEFLLSPKIDLAYRPVHHTLIGSKFTDPVDSFWELIYEKCEVLVEDLFPMMTHVDGQTLRPYFNAGCIVTRPNLGLFQLWWNTFKKWYLNEEFVKFYKINDLYAVFIHQAILTGIIIAKIKKNKLYELPYSYNYPLNLYLESEPDYKPKDLDKLTSARYCNKLRNPEFLEELPFSDNLKSWIKALISPYITQ